MQINPFILAILVLLSSNGLFGYLSYKFYREKGFAEAALISCQRDNNNMEKVLVKQQKELEDLDTLLAVYQQKQKELQQKQCDTITQIIRLPSKGNQDEVDIDAHLPDGLTRLLREGYNSLQGSSNSNATESSN